MADLYSKFRLLTYAEELYTGLVQYLKLVVDNIDYSGNDYNAMGAATGTLTNTYLEIPAAPLNNRVDFTVSAWVSSLESEFTILSCKRGTKQVLEITNLRVILNDVLYEGEEIMATIAREYIANVAPTVTNLHSLASSQTFVTGWTSALIDNTANAYEDILLSALFTMAASNNQAGEIRIYIYTMLDDSVWPDLFSAGTEGTEGTATLHDTEQRDNGMRLLAGLTVDNGASEVHAVPMTSIASLFGGVLPPKFAIFVTGNATTTTTAQLAASGNAINLKGTRRKIV